MPKHRVIGGVVVTTPEGVFANYRPAAHLMPAEVWEIVRPVAITASSAADYVSVASAHHCLGTVAHFLAWAHREGLSLDLESIFVPDYVERYCATALRHLATETQSTRRGYLRRVGAACTKKAPWPPPPMPFANNHTIQPPYSDEEVEALWAAAKSQATDHRERVATAMLTLGLGAGVKPGEMLAVTAETVKAHPQDPRLVVILLEDRVVPVRSQHVEHLLDLCDRYPEEPLVGVHKETAKDPLGALRQNVQWPEWLAFRPARLRTTWMADVLAQNLRISEFMTIAGTVSSKSLEVIAPYVAQRIEHDDYLFAAAGLVRR